jgi:hypothetical protein
VTLLALDFDGTMTDAELEGAPFTLGYLDDLALLCGRRTGDDELAEIAARARALVDSDPEAAFVWMGHAVAPSRVDPYLRIVPIAHAVLDHFGAFPRPEDRSALLGRLLYKYNYAKTRTVPRPGAKALLESLAGTDTWVVTNSYTEHVTAKIATVLGAPGGGWLAERVRGNASKFEIDEAWTEAPQSLAIPGLQRPVLLRRHKYWSVLKGVLGGRGFDQLAVVGDIFELDLAMPLALGARVGLVAGPNTPPHEIAFVAGHSRGRVLRSLDEVKDFAYAPAS